MKILIFSILILLSSQKVYPQLVNFNWAKQMGGASIETGYAITTDASGNVYTIGNFAGTVDFDPGPGSFNLTATSNADVFVSKLDSAGNFIWVKQMEGSDYAFGISIALDAQRNIYITGGFAGGVDFDPSPAIFALSVIGRIDVFIAKLDAIGNFIWAKQMGVGLTTSTGNSLNVDAAGKCTCNGVNI